MNMSWLTLPAYLAVQLGFAGLFGMQIAHLRRSTSTAGVAIAILLAPLGMLPPHSMPEPLQTISRLMAALVVALFALSILPQRWHSQHFARRYGTLAMMAIACWGLSSGPAAPTFILGLLAALAAAMIWPRSA